MHLTLIVLNGPGKGQVFQLEGTGAAVSIGRQAPQLKVRDSEVSRQHAELSYENNTWLIRDRGSTNGTYVNGKRISAITELEEGDQILIGRVLLVVAQIVDDERADTHEPDEYELRATPAASAAVHPSPTPPAIDEDDEEDYSHLPGAEALVLGRSSEADFADEGDAPVASKPRGDEDERIDLDLAEPDSESLPAAPFARALASDDDDEDWLEIADSAAGREGSDASGGEEVAALPTPSSPVKAEPEDEDDWLEIAEPEGAEAVSDNADVEAEPGALSGVEADEAFNDEAGALDLAGADVDDAAPAEDIALARPERPVTPVSPARSAAASPESERDEEEVLRALAELTAEDEEASSSDAEGYDADALAALRELAAGESVDDAERPDSLFESTVKESREVPLDPRDVGDVLLSGDEDESILTADEDSWSDSDDDAPVSSATTLQPAAAPKPTADDDEDSDGTGLLHHIGLSEKDARHADDELLDGLPVDDDIVLDDEAEERAMSQETGQSLAAIKADDAPPAATPTKPERGINLSALAADAKRPEAGSGDISAAVQTHVPYQHRAAAMTPPPSRSATPDYETPRLAPANRTDSPNSDRSSVPGKDTHGGGPAKGAVVVLLTTLILGGGATGLWYASQGGYVHLPQVSLGSTPSPRDTARPVATPPPVVPAVSLTPPPAPVEPVGAGEKRQRLLRDLVVAVPPASIPTDAPAADSPERVAAALPPTAAEPVFPPASTSAGLPDASADAAPGAASEPTPLAMADAHATTSPVLVDPPPAAAASRVHRVAYLVDASGSLIDTLALVVDWLSAELRKADPASEFTVVFFRNGEAIEAPGGMHDATAQHVDAVSRWMQLAEGNVIPSGRSDPTAALRRAVEAGAGEVVILSDDSISSRMTQERVETLLGEVDRAIANHDVTVHTVQFFYRDPMRVLERLAERYGGSYRFVEPELKAEGDPLLEAMGNLTAAPTERVPAP